MGPQPSSRGNNTASTRAAPCVRASMGPQPSSRGNASRCPATPTSMAASMGPQPSSRGNMSAARWNAVSSTASMGPQPSSRGNSPCEHITPSSGRLCFNGAATFQSRKSACAQDRPRPSNRLQWGRNLPVAEMGNRTDGKSDEPPCFNGAATFQSRKLLPPLLPPPNPTCFNGAATFQSRKFACRPRCG